nr:MAG TPA: Common central domain of tyrosinase [Herelleviridae sp.]
MGRFSWHGVRGFLLEVVYIIHCNIDALYVSLC